MHRAMKFVVLVFIGGGMGAVLRYLSGMAVMRLAGAQFPWGTMLVNILGSLAMGLLIAWLTRRSAGDAELRLMLATGFLGGFTTFSAFSLDAVALYERGALTAAAVYVIATVTLSILALFGGLWLARQF